MISINAPTSYFLYSSFSFFGPHCGNEIPGTWFVRALEPLARSPEVVRTELHRMVSDGELIRRKEGRRNFYRPTSVARAEIEAGARKMFAAKPDHWDGRWTLIIAQFTTMQRVERDRLRSLLNVEGFASLGNGVSVHPRPASAGLKRALVDMKLQHVVKLFAGAELTSGVLEPTGLWNLRDLQCRYAKFLARYASVKTEVSSLEAFALRFAVVFDYLEVAWRDPELPRRLLPSRWNGRRAQLVASQLYRTLLPKAIDHGKALMAADRD